MPRIHLFELEDQSWFPATLRDAATAYLRLAAEASGQAAKLAPVLARALRRTGAKQVVDLCSGGAGPVPPIVRALREAGIESRFLLTDRFPNVGSFQRIAEESGGSIEYTTEPVDATAVPPGLDGFRTFFNAFHHFRPDVAQDMLQSAVDARRPIGIFELVGRSPVQLLGVLTSPLLVLLVVPLLRPFQWRWLLFTYVLPLIPLVTLWDGLVSCLRVYSQRDLRKLVDRLDARAADYEWEIGRIPLAPGIGATYLVGYPPPG